jgi:elongation factor Ts
MMELKMPAITASMVAELRAKTDAPMMMCKKALTEADGDMARAEETAARQARHKARARRARDRRGRGRRLRGGTAGAMIEVNCETDFVTKNDDFIAFANKLAKLVAEKNPADVAALSALTLERPDASRTRTRLVGKIGENMSHPPLPALRRRRKLASYLHGTRIGVVVEFEGDDTAAKDVAMHVAAMKPVALSSADVPPSWSRRSARSPRRRPPSRASRPTSSPRWSRARCRST